MSTIHTIAPPSRQLSLISVAPAFRITKNAQARNAYGAVAQEIVCAILGLDPIPINGAYSICFDAHSGDTFYEIKSCKQGGKVVIYDWRMEKERAALVPLRYAILLHRVSKSTGANLFREICQSKLELLSVPAWKVHELAELEPLRQLAKPSADPRCGYSRHGYKEGYRNVPVKALRELCTSSVTHTVCIYNETFTVRVSSL